MTIGIEASRLVALLFVGTTVFACSPADTSGDPVGSGGSGTVSGSGGMGGAGGMGGTGGVGGTGDVGGTGGAGGMGGGGQGGGFDVTLTPPVLVDPTMIVLPTDVPPSHFGQYGACGDGNVYLIILESDEDALITFDDTVPLPYPVHVRGGRNVILRGLEIVLETQPGNEVGSIPMTQQQYNTTNPHPVVPACGGLRLKVNNSTHWVEGLFLDTKGHDSDGIILNTEGGPNSTVAIQNSRIQGIEGSLDLHGDILQLQGGHLKHLIFENVTMRQALEGVVLSGLVDEVTMRNVDYDTDTRYDADDAWDDIVVGGFFAGSQTGSGVNMFSIENIYIKYKNPGTDKFFVIGDKHFSGPASAGQVYAGQTLETHPDAHFLEAPPNGDYAPESQVGRYYQFNP